MKNLIKKEHEYIKFSNEIKQKNQDIEIKIKKFNVFRLIRICLDLEVSELSKKIEVSESYIRSIERNEKYPSMKIINKYCQTAGINLIIFLNLQEKIDNIDGFGNALYEVISELKKNNINNIIK